MLINDEDPEHIISIDKSLEHLTSRQIGTRLRNHRPLRRFIRGGFKPAGALSIMPCLNSNLLAELKLVQAGAVLLEVSMEG